MVEFPTDWGPFGAGRRSSPFVDPSGFALSWVPNCLVGASSTCLVRVVLVAASWTGRLFLADRDSGFLEGSTISTSSSDDVAGALLGGENGCAFCGERERSMDTLALPLLTVLPSSSS